MTTQEIQTKEPYIEITESKPNYFVAEIYDSEQKTDSPRTRIKVNSISKLFDDWKKLSDIK